MHVLPSLKKNLIGFLSPFLSLPQIHIWKPRVTMLWPTLLALAAIVEAAPQRGGLMGGGTLLRFGCSQITIERLDPLVNPGLSPTPHMHQVVGGNAFNISMTKDDVSNVATCTTCSFTDDLSNYWTANLYFRARNGSYKRVPQVPNRYSDNLPSLAKVASVSLCSLGTDILSPGYSLATNLPQ